MPCSGPPRPNQKLRKAETRRTHQRRPWHSLHRKARNVLGSERRSETAPTRDPSIRPSLSAARSSLAPRRRRMPSLEAQSRCPVERRRPCCVLRPAEELESGQPPRSPLVRQPRPALQPRPWRAQPLQALWTFRIRSPGDRAQSTPAVRQMSSWAQESFPALRYMQGAACYPGAARSNTGWMDQPPSPSGATLSQISIRSPELATDSKSTVAR